MRARSGVPFAGAVVAGMVLAAGFAPARAAVCGTPPQAPVVEIAISEPEVVLDHSRSKAELTTLAAEEYGYSHGAGHIVFGLTTALISSQLSVQTLTRERSDGVYCTWPGRVTATVAFEGPITVHVAREYAKRTCQHRAVLRHEMEHVEVYKATLRDYDKRLRRALERAVDKGRFPITDRKRDKIDAELRDYFQAAFSGAVAAVQSEQDRLNARLDTPEGYRRTRDLCDSW